MTHRHTRTFSVKLLADVTLKDEVIEDNSYGITHRRISLFICNNEDSKHPFGLFFAVTLQFCWELLIKHSEN